LSTPDRPANRLAREASPYLRQHMYNPVDWYPWSDEAFERAVAEQKPILLSVGYAACHWCHVMEKDAFEVEEVAALMNRDFVSIKVDREERPDVDALYQGVVQLMGRGGGWPLTVFMTPDRRPFFGGTYFPPRAAYGMPGFSQVLGSLADAWKNRREEVEKSAASFEEGLSRFARLGLGVEGEHAVGVPDLVRAADRIVQEGDTDHGGFFGAPKFPHPMELSFLLRMAASGLEEMTDDRRRDAERLLRQSLDAMYRGGIYDHVAGGFHRYSVDEAWAVPHFEKMLYDNALLLRVYAEGAVALGDDSYATVAREIAGWMARELQDTKGAFYSSQDADSEGVEGKFFVWTRAQLDEALGPRLAADAAARYGVTEEGNFEHGATVLHLARPEVPASGEEAAEIRRRLLEARERRDRPATDDKVITAWNGLAIGGLAAAGRLLLDRDLVAQARQAAECLLQTFETSGGLHRIWRNGQVKEGAFLDDFGAMSEGLLELFEATGDARYLVEARRFAEEAIRSFWDDDAGMFWLAPAPPAADGGGQADELPHRMPSVHDNAAPSGASSLTTALVRLHALTGEARFGEIAERWLRRQRDEMLRNPFGFGHLLGAAFLAARGIDVVAVVGREGRERDSLLAAARRGLRPEVLAFASTDSTIEAVAGKGEVDGRPAAYVCRQFACEAPRTDPGEVSDALGMA